MSHKIMLQFYPCFFRNPPFLHLPAPAPLTARVVGPNSINPRSIVRLITGKRGSQIFNKSDTHTASALSLLPGPRPLLTRDEQCSSTNYKRREPPMRLPNEDGCRRRCWKLSLSRPGVFCHVTSVLPARLSRELHVR